MSLLLLLLIAFLKLGVCIDLPPLPYGYSSLQPYIGFDTLHYHHDAHFAKYVETTNQIIQGTDMKNADVVTIVKAANATKNVKLFNNAAQAYNHGVYFSSMTPGGGGSPPEGKIKNFLTSSFGIFENFRTQWISVGNELFGSGYVWLVYTTEDDGPTGAVPSGGGVFRIVTTKDAENPLTWPGNYIVLMTMDVWEHAYYLDYKNMRKQYVTAFIDHLVNWDFVAAQLPDKLL